MRPAFDPALALTATYAERPWDLDGAFTNDDDVLDWVADDGRRRGDGAPVLVAHSTAAYAVRHLADPEAIYQQEILPEIAPDLAAEGAEDGVAANADAEPTAGKHADGDAHE